MAEADPNTDATSVPAALQSGEDVMQTRAFPRADQPLDWLLADEPFRFEFFQAVRLMGLLHPERKAVGRDADPADEILRFKVRATHEFPASAIHTLVPGKEGAPPEMTVHFLGTVGPVGALPRHYTQMLLDRARVKDPTLREFLDLFHHRLISLFQRAWEKYRFFIGYETSRDDKFTQYIFDIAGVGTPGLRGRLDVNDQALAHYSGLLSQGPRSAAALEALLADYFGVKAEVRQFQGRWLNLPAEDRSRIGQVNSRPGLDLVAGNSVYDVQGRFRLRMGAMTFKQYQAFMPDGSAFRPVAQLCRLFVGVEFDFEVQPVLKKEEVPPCLLGDPRKKTGARLGWTSWLTTAPLPRDADDVVFESPV